MSTQEASPLPHPARLPSLTGLRFLAAALVFLFHSSIAQVFSAPPLRYGFLFVAGGGGFVGVSFFFVLSGYVLTWSSHPGSRPAGFWRRRFVKIFPNHVVTFVIALVLISWAGESSGLWQSVTNLLLLHAWIPEYSYMVSVNAVSWSLSAEALFYLAFPLLSTMVGRIRPGRLWWWAGAAIVGVVLAPPAVQALLPDQPRWSWGPASFAQIWSVYAFPPVRLLEFALGMLLARIVLTGRWIRLPLPAVFLLVLAGYGASLFAPFLYRFAACTVIPLALLIPAAAAADVQGRRTVLSTRVMVWLGEISFAFYLVHGLVLAYGHRAFGPPTNAFSSGPAWSTPVGLGFLLACFTVAVLLSWALHVLVERPAMRRWAGRPAAPAPTPAPDDGCQVLPEGLTGRRAGSRPEGDGSAADA
ncbi:acyltransferase family protein [Streptosporangium roseum]|uniref:acyltransferase family protein n=1 Tax=Streptosporangium roseum TaxID=2001 RepID=UPI0033332355